jgi:mRNA interferase MazF
VGVVGPVSRFDVFLVALDPTLGREIKKTRPCLVISPDEMNKHLDTVIIAPMTTKGRDYPTRVACTFQGETGKVVLDQIRTVDKVMLVKRLGTLAGVGRKRTMEVLGEMFL